uniref:U3 small nucleolar RNA-associated protein 14 n=1 Tax=Trypanosoma congolense (strain IL3000) TaxID=1068625 RepID=G0UYH2_TRYCI|nr:conserved hypothetical protein [Trypanosoma congolense IL3000]
MRRGRDDVSKGKIRKGGAAAAADGAKSARKGRVKKGCGDVQKAGVLNLSNPLIPPELDEDIDDDLAFNSDDEQMYGHFFSKKGDTESSVPTDAGKRKKKKTKSSKGQDGDESVVDDEDSDLLVQQLRALGEIDAAEDLNFHDQEGGDEDDDYIDIADMFDAAERNEEEKEHTTRGERRKKKFDEDGVAKKRRRSRITEEPESIYGPATGVTSDSFGRAIHQMLDAAPDAGTQARLQRSLASKSNLVSIDVDDYTKERGLREKVREVVTQDLDKYKSFLRNYHESNHIQLPMAMPKSNPIPSSLGAIAAAAESRFTEKKAGKRKAAAEGPSFPTPEGMSDNAPRDSAFRLASKVNTLLTKAGISKPQLKDSQTSDGIIPLGEDNDAEEDQMGGSARYTKAPTTSYMAKLKAMLSYENARRRRVNRIKSKTYRRIMRQEREREKERRDKAFELLHPEKARARLAMRLMKARIEERVTQKHKNTSKWVRHAKRFAQFDDNTKDAINEQHMLHEQLMRKMEEDADADDFLNAAKEDGSDMSSEEERVVDHIIADATGKLSSQGDSNVAGDTKERKTSLLWRGIDADGDANEDTVTEMSKATPTEKARMELRGMKFMRQAREREEKRYEEILNQMQRDICRSMRGEEIREDAEPSDLDEAGDSHNDIESKKRRTAGDKPINPHSSTGRLTFTQVNSRSERARNVNVIENIKLKRTRGIDAQEQNVPGNEEGTSQDDPENWSIKEDGSDAEGVGVEKSVTSDANELPDARGGEDEFAAARIASTISSKQSTTNNGSSTVGKKACSTRVTILPEVTKRGRDGALPLGSTDTKGKATASGLTSKRRKVDRGEGAQGDSETRSPQGNEGGDDEAALLKQQEYLIARAFAHDDVDADFLAEKTAQVTNIMRPVDKNASLPGWGEWGGSDPRLNTKHQAKVQAMELQREIEKTTLLKSRADAALDHVIINHDGVELVPDRMLLHMVPRPFSNPTEFARSMRHPYGPEWNTALSFKDANEPRVEVRQGHIVQPLDLSLRGKKLAKTTRRKNKEKT